MQPTGVPSEGDWEDASPFPKGGILCSSLEGTAASFEAISLRRSFGQYGELQKKDANTASTSILWLPREPRNPKSDGSPWP